MRNDLLKQFRFLTDAGAVFSEEGDDASYRIFRFAVADLRIAVSCDYRREFVNLCVKRHTEVLLETAGNRAVINAFSTGAADFVDKLKQIYAQPRKGYSLSKRQMRQLIRLYAEYLASVLFF